MSVKQPSETVPHNYMSVTDKTSTSDVFRNNLAGFKDSRVPIALQCKKTSPNYMSNTLTQHKKASNHHANLPLEMYSFTL